METKVAGGRESKACEETENADENARPKESQTFTFNQSKRDVLGGDAINRRVLPHLKKAT